ncbi:MAG TPA: hypothetical protein VN937_11370 [Blastocatellia bacterium]|nr:hypothetical protein [Blastocatellia bacterium]
MSLKEARKRTSTESRKGKDPHPYVIDESEIRALVGSLDIHYMSTVAARFQIVADLTSGAFEEKIDRLDSSDLMLIKQIANEDDSDYYRRIMSAIVASLGRGRQGINAAHLTASLAVLMTFRWSPEYRSALDDYRHRVRREKLNRLERAPRRGTSGRSVSHSSSDQMTKTPQRRTG